MKKLKKIDGSVVDVAEDYKPAEGETFLEVKTDITEQLKPVFETLSQNLAESSKSTKLELAEIQKQVKDSEAKIHLEIAKLIQKPAEKKVELTEEFFINTKVKTGHYHKDDPVYKMAVGMTLWNRGKYEEAVREGYIKLATTDIMGTDTAALGGALIPTGFELDLRADTGKYSLFGELVKPLQTNFQIVQMARRTSASTTYLQAEKVAATRSKPAVESKSIYVELITTAIESSRQILEDAEAFLNLLQVDAMDSRGKFLDTAWLTATGHVTGTTLCTGLAAVSDAQSVSGGAVGNISTANFTRSQLNSMVTKISPRNRQNLAFIFNPNVMGVIRDMVDDNNSPIFKEYIGVGDNNLTVMGRIFGIPVYESYALASTDAAENTVFGILADVSRVTKARYKTGMSIEPVFYGVNADAVDLQSAYEFKLYVRERLGVENFADLDVDGENHQICVIKTPAA